MEDGCPERTALLRRWNPEICLQTHLVHTLPPRQQRPGGAFPAGRAQGQALTIKECAEQQHRPFTGTAKATDGQSHISEAGAIVTPAPVSAGGCFPCDFGFLICRGGS